MNLKGCGAVLIRQAILLVAFACLSFGGAFAQQNTNVTELIPPGSTWKFLSTELPDPLWRAAEYNDSRWNIGLAQLGYGDGDEATLVRTSAPPHPITTYFRNSFVLPEAMTFATAHIRLLRDDGAVVYINGNEVLRDNMPDGEITPQTVATSSTENENAFREYTIPVQQLLRAGNNVIAVEVHQANMTSTDMSFDLSLGVSTFFSEQDMAIISIRATQPMTSEPLPNALVAPGEFTVFRLDPLLHMPLYVNLGYSGSATTNDYEPLPRTVYFPAGTNAVSFLVLPRTDHLVEGTESVVAQIAGGPNIWDRTSPHRAYWQRMSNSVAEVLIRDANTNTNPLPVVSIDALVPGAHEQPVLQNGGLFRIKRTGPVDSALNVFLRYEGTAKLGEDVWSMPSNVWLAPGITETNIPVIAIDDSIPEPTETVIAILTTNLGPATYTINPLARRATVSVLDNDTTPSTLTITEPQNGETFQHGEPITITAVAVDQLGHIPRVEFYDGTNRIGVSEIVFIQQPAPSTPIQHSIVWSNATPGPHTLTAFARDSRQFDVRSAPVNIFVNQVTPEMPVIGVRTVNFPLAPNTNADHATRMFEFYRIGRGTEPLLIFFTKSGSATPGVDYHELPSSITFAPGTTSTNLPVFVIDDTIVEGTETVIVTLKPAPPTIDSPYRTQYVIDPANQAASVAIFDNDRSTPTNRPPQVTITRPVDGSVFPLGEQIHISASANDPDGSVTNIDLFINGQLAWRTNSLALAFRWDNAPAGEHTLRAVATDGAGVSTESSPVRILVRGTNNTSFVRRELPAGYTPGVSFRVRLVATPPTSAQAWAVEDAPPGGWLVSGITDGGVYDPATGKVKFGHFMETTNRVLLYHVTPPAGSINSFEFAGTASADGRSVPITGDCIISPLAAEYHPADADLNKRIVLNEVTAYAAAWKRGTNWPSGPVPIPSDYVTRAAFIWRNGEGYRFIATNPPPHCWVPTNAPRAFFAPSASTAERTINADGNARSITVSIAPGASAAAYTLEEKIPVGWTTSNISNDGAFDPAAGKIRWGLFMDAERRTLTYTLTPSSGSTFGANMAGQLSVDGETIPVGGESTVNTDPAQVLRVTASASATQSGISLRLNGPVGQVCALEASTDLTTWESVADLYLPDGQLQLIDPASGEAPQRYYRLRAD